jgi:hypothetical protein
MTQVTWTMYRAQTNVLAGDIPASVPTDQSFCKGSDGVHLDGLMTNPLSLHFCHAIL